MSAVILIIANYCVLGFLHCKREEKSNGGNIGCYKVL